MARGENQLRLAVYSIDITPIIIQEIWLQFRYN